MNFKTLLLLCEALVLIVPLVLASLLIAVALIPVPKLAFIVSEARLGAMGGFRTDGDEFELVLELVLQLLALLLLVLLLLSLFPTTGLLTVIRLVGVGIE